MIRPPKKKALIQLRKKGLGYKLIAKKLRISRDQARDYLRTKESISLLKGVKQVRVKSSKRTLKRAKPVRSKGAKRLLKKKRRR